MGRQSKLTPTCQWKATIHLADRVCTLTADYTDAYILTSISEVRQYVEENKGLHFYPEYVEALVGLTGTESVWLDLVSSETFRKIDLSDKAYIDIHPMSLSTLPAFFLTLSTSAASLRQLIRPV